MKNRVLKPVRKIAKKIFLSIPAHLSKNQKHIDIDGVNLIKESIKRNYHTGWRSENNYSKEMYEEDLNAHLYERLKSDRDMVIPWIDHSAKLQGKRILEIGCGTGSSTIALAEQGAKVTGIDIDEGALSVAKDRAKVYDIEAEFRALNGDQILGAFDSDKFDMVIFFACLEHMTIPERLASLRHAWDTIPPKGLLVIVETPNRLWHFDKHTSMLPFFNWLPDELAFHYSSFSPKENFREVYKDYNADSKEHFLRRGRGMSFHEIEMSICPVQNLNVISSLSTYEGLGYKLKKSKRDRKYKSLLKKMHPSLHEGFFDDFLYLIIEK